MRYHQNAWRRPLAACFLLALTCLIPSSAVGQGFQVDAMVPGLVRMLDRRDFDAIGTSREAIVDAMIVFTAVGNSACHPESVVEDGFPVSAEEASLSINAVAQRHPLAIAAAGAGMLRHEYFRTITQWVREVGCQDERVLDLGRDATLYFVWVHTGRVPESVRRWEAGRGIDGPRLSFGSEAAPSARDAPPAGGASRRAPTSEPALPPPSSDVAELVAAATGSVEPHAPAYLDGDLVFALLLAHGLNEGVEHDWHQLTWRRLEYETYIRDRLGGDFAAHSHWPPIFPADAQRTDITDAVVSSYRDWTIARAEHMPDAVWERGYLFAAEPDGPAPLYYRPRQSIRLLDVQTARAVGVDIARVRPGHGLRGGPSFVPLMGSGFRDDVMLVYPRPIAEYVVETPAALSDVPREEVRLRIELSLDSVRIVPAELHDVIVLDVTPGDLILLRDGTEVWRGPVGIRPSGGAR